MSKKELNLKSGSINVMQVFHDNWCKSNTKKKMKPTQCNCNPTVKMIEINDEKTFENSIKGK